MTVPNILFTLGVAGVAFFLSHLYPGQQVLVWLIYGMVWAGIMLHANRKTIQGRVRRG
jgi:hypothetical protein